MSTDKAEGLSPRLKATIAVKVGELEYILRHGRDGNIGAASNRHKLLTEFAERIAALAQQAQWQPIETAPKDGTFVLIGFGDSVGEARWVENAWYWANNDPGDSWGRPVYEHEATHWMPLPAPPQAERPPEETR